jgi:hypothetical protein
VTTDPGLDVCLPDAQAYDFLRLVWCSLPCLARLIAAQIIGAESCGVADNEKRENVMGKRSKATLTEAELRERRLAVESALGSLRIEGMELEPEERKIFDRFANGEISLSEMRSAVRAYTATIV